MSYTEKPAKQGETPRSIEGAPEVIYLQTGGRNPSATFDDLDTEQVTWCADPMEEDDTKYIRADVAERELAQMAKRVSELDALKEAMAQLSNQAGLELFADAFVSELEERAAAILAEKEKCNG